MRRPDQLIERHLIQSQTIGPFNWPWLFKSSKLECFFCFSFGLNPRPSACKTCSLPLSYDFSLQLNWNELSFDATSLRTISVWCLSSQCIRGPVLTVLHLEMTASEREVTKLVPLRWFSWDQWPFSLSLLKIISLYELTYLGHNNYVTLWKNRCLNVLVALFATHPLFLFHWMGRACVGCCCFLNST